MGSECKGITRTGPARDVNKIWREKKNGVIYEDKDYLTIDFVAVMKVNTVLMSTRRRRYVGIDQQCQTRSGADDRTSCVYL